MSSYKIIAAETPRRCELCGKLNVETRPYGPRGERVCFDCGMADIDGTRRGFRKLVLGENKNETPDKV